MILPNDPEYQCKMDPVPQTQLTSETIEIKGTHIKIPTRTLFITEDGSVYVVGPKQKNGTHVYSSLKGLIAAVLNTTIIENFSEPPTP